LVAGRWALSWTCVGLLVGIVVVVATKAGQSSPPLWLLVTTLVGGGSGFALGLLFACLMTASRPLRTPFHPEAWPARVGPGLMCGAVAGAILGMGSAPEGAVLLGTLGATSAAISRFEGKLR